MAHNAIGTTLNFYDDTSFNVFQPLNGPAAQILTCGNIFLGIQGYMGLRFPLAEGPDPRSLGRGGTVLADSLLPQITLTAAGTWTAGGSISISMLLDDSPRDGPQDLQLAWKPPGGSGPSWRRDAWGVFDTRLEDTGGAPFIDNGVGTLQVGMSIFTDLREELGARIVVPAGPSWSVARVINLMSRFGIPIGSTEVALQGNSVNAAGYDEPDGVDLGVSAAVANTPTIPLQPAGGNVTFAFAPDVVLAPGIYWVVTRPSVPYVADFTNFIAWKQKRVFLGVGGSHRHGPAFGIGFDQANYWGVVDVFFDVTAKELPAIIWSPPAAVFGDTIQTPDLSALIQEVITTSGHEATSAVGFTFKTVGETRTFRFASNEHATLAAPSFFAQYKARYARPDGAL